MKRLLNRSMFRLMVLLLLLVAGMIFMLRSPLGLFEGKEEYGRDLRLLVPGGSTTVHFQLDPEDDWMTQPQPGEPVIPASMDVDLRSLPQTGPVEPSIVPDFEPGGIEPTDPRFIDPVLEAPSEVLAIPSPSANFAGLDFSSWGAGWPPDTNGDIGINYYIQTVNTSIGIYNRSGVQQAAFTFNTFFSGTGTPCDGNNNGDPVVLFDDVSGRWIITDFAWSNTMDGPYYECIAVSKTSDPVSGGWWMYGLLAHNNYLNDYPKLGVWQDGIYMTANLFDCLNSFCSSALYKGVRIWALNRSDLIAGSPLNYQFADLGTAYFSLLPAHARGSSMPAAGTPNYMGSIQTSTQFYTWKYAIDWATPSNSTLTGPLSTTIASYSNAASVPQPSPGTNLDSLAGRLMVQLQYSEASGAGALWVTHSVSTSGRAGIRWYEFRGLSGTPSVYQQGTYSPDSTHRWMGSVGVDQSGNMAVVYSASSSSVYPQIRYAGRLSTDTLGTLGQGEATLIAGTGSQTSYTRWGDYAGMSIDPTDECTFWFSTEYLSSTGTNWQTRIGAFKFPGCGTASLSFFSGWNLVTLPITPNTGYTAQSFLTDANGQGNSCTEIDRWKNGGWEGFVDGYPFDDFTLEMGAGYFVYCSASGSMSYSGIKPTSSTTLALVPGWNLAAIPYPGTYTAQTLLTAISAQGGTCSEVDRRLSGSWDAYIDGGTGTNFSIASDQGYFVLCSTTGSFTP